MEVILKSLLFLIYLMSTVPVMAFELEFRKNNQIILKIDEAKLHSGKLTIAGKKISSTDKTLFNPFRKYQKTYRGHPLYEILDAVYGKTWKGAERITFVALDGYIQKAKIKDMLLASIGKTGYLAYGDSKKNKLSSFKKGKKTIDPNPVYLVWSGFKDTDLGKHADPLKWPYQLKAINLSW